MEQQLPVAAQDTAQRGWTGTRRSQEDVANERGDGLALGQAKLRHHLEQTFRLGALERSRPADSIYPGWTPLGDRPALDYQLAQGGSRAAGIKKLSNGDDAVHCERAVSNCEKELVREVRQPVYDRGCGDQERRPADQPRRKMGVASSVGVSKVMTLVDDHQTSRALRQLSTAYLLVGPENQSHTRSVGGSFPLTQEGGRYQASGCSPVHPGRYRESDEGLAGSHRIGQ
jgi:hypothetical protein